MMKIGSYYTTTRAFERDLIEGRMPTLDLLFFDRELAQIGGLRMAAGLYAVKMAALEILEIKNSSCLDLCLIHTKANRQKPIILKDTPWITDIKIGFYQSKASSLAIAVGCYRDG